MTDRIIDIAETAAYLHGRGELLCIQPKAADEAASSSPEVTIPFKELAAVVLTHPRVTCSRTALSGIAGAGAILVTCDDHFTPVAMMLPLTGYHAPARRMAAQADAGAPVRKRMWQQIIVAKVRAQAALLKRVRGDDFGLLNLASQVRSGDPENIEGQAARIYWPALFDSEEFLRNTGAVDQNRFLNYGYAVLRASVARAICASGLHPGLGLHHHHRNNAFCLADDLMEPFRPLIDAAVVEIVGDGKSDDALDKHLKARLIAPVMDRYKIKGQSRTLFDILARLTASVAAGFESSSAGTSLELPDVDEW
jgi:CRISPR-associated protein Cas1